MAVSAGPAEAAGAAEGPLSVGSDGLGVAVGPGDGMTAAGPVAETGDTASDGAGGPSLGSSTGASPASAGVGAAESVGAGDAESLGAGEGVTLGAREAITVPICVIGAVESLGAVRSEGLSDPTGADEGVPGGTGSV